jgi:hypothetical protein
LFLGFRILDRGVGALVGLGFKESAVRRALEQLRHRDGNTPCEGHETPLARLIRAGLGVLAFEPLGPRGPRRLVRS